MNECSVIKPLLALRVEDWSAAERARVETHLEACEACASLRAVYLEQDRLIQNLPPVRLTAAQRGEVWAQTDGEPSAPRGSIFLALNVFSALSTTFVLIVATVNLLLASWTSLVREDVPLMAVPTPAPIVVQHAAPMPDSVFRQRPSSEPRPEPAPQPERAYISDDRSDAGQGAASEQVVFCHMNADMKEIV
jgi:anti-sigma factor RsiW